MSSEKKCNDDYDDECADAEVPAMRSRVGTSEAGPPSPVPKLQTASVGHAVKVGTVYILEAEDGSFAKIGFTTKLKMRLAQLEYFAARNMSKGLRLVGFFPATQYVETLLHRRFRNYRLDGDWYSPEIIELFARSGPLPEMEWSDTDQGAAPAEVLEYFRKQGAKGGKIGGKARAAKLSAERRREIARKAGKAGAKARWGTKPVRKESAPPE